MLEALVALVAEHAPARAAHRRPPVGRPQDARRARLPAPTRRRPRGGDRDDGADDRTSLGRPAPPSRRRTRSSGSSRSRRASSRRSGCPTCTNRPAAIRASSPRRSPTDRPPARRGRSPRRCSRSAAPRALGLPRPRRRLGRSSSRSSRSRSPTPRRRRGRAHRGARAPLRTADPAHRRPPFPLPLRPRPPGAARKHLTRPAAPAAAAARRKRRRTVPDPPRARLAGRMTPMPSERELMSGTVFEHADEPAYVMDPEQQPHPRRQRRRLRAARVHARGAARDTDLAYPPVRAARAERASRTRPARRAGLDDQAHVPNEAAARSSRPRSRSTRSRSAAGRASSGSSRIAASIASPRRRLSGATAPGQVLRARSAMQSTTVARRRNRGDYDNTTDCDDARTRSRRARSKADPRLPRRRRSSRTRPIRCSSGRSLPTRPTTSRPPTSAPSC